jgi:DNA invertase Pin-like site-specific DNA recombinase
MVGAVIYVRVSTKEQTENLSLPTQLRACEEYCRRHGYDVLERFHEEGESAKSIDRSQLQNLLTYCRLNKGRVHFVVVFNLTRFARDKYDHFALRSHLQSLGISLRSATEPIDDSSTGKLMEGVLAAFAQFDNDVRSDRTRAGMKAALELGRWVFLAPVGYLNAPRSTGKSLMHDPERSPLVRRAFEDYATGQYTKEQLLKRVRAWGLTNRRGKPLTSQAIGMLLRNQLYAGIVDVPEYGVRGKRGDFDPLISEELFFQVQSVLSGRIPSTAPRQRAHPDFPLRGFVRCESCGRGLTGSWSKGRNEYYAYYHCRPGCRAVNVTKTKLEGMFADELALLQPTPGYMRLLKESVLQIWKARKASVREEIASAERAAKAIQDNLDRLDEAFLFERSIDIETYDRHAEKLREELTLVRMDRHSGQLEELDVEGILVRRAHPAARRRSVGAGLTRPTAAVPTTVLSRRNRVRRKSLYWNRRNRTGLQLLAGNRDRVGRFGGPDGNRTALRQARCLRLNTRDKYRVSRGAADSSPERRQTGVIASSRL